MADISAAIAAIQGASRGEEVRDSICDALEAVNEERLDCETVNGHTVGTDVPTNALFLTSSERSRIDSIPVPAVEDAGKFLRVDSSGAWAMVALSNAEGVGF